jgi:N-carbamoyl-L-amino-acid hydrolase
VPDDVQNGFDRRWSELEPIGRHGGTGGYRRQAWTAVDAELREWFAGQARQLGLDLTTDRGGNQWAWWGDPDRTPGVATGSHLDSVPDGGAFDGPLGVVGALTAVESLRAAGFQPRIPIGVVNLSDGEGARFGVASAGTRIITGGLDADRAAGLTDDDGISLAAAMAAAGHREIGRDDETLRRVDTFVELHVEQGRALAATRHPVGVASAIWPHGRWRFEFPGRADHAGTARLDDRQDPVLDLASTVLAVRDAAYRHGALATIGKVRLDPGGTSVIPARALAWLDARAPSELAVLGLVEELVRAAVHTDIHVAEESWTPITAFDPVLRDRLAGLLGAPVLGTGAGHDAGVLSAAGIRSAMLFARNPTGVSHSPAEFAERDDCVAAVAALATVLRELTS